jgi:hypothetical protein
MYVIRQECGQRWYRRRSWARNFPLFRTYPGGFAFGPIMIYKEN